MRDNLCFRSMTTTKLFSDANLNSFCIFVSEVNRLKEEDANLITIKIQYDKQLLNERTLKTQVSLEESNLNW